MKPKLLPCLLWYVVGTLPAAQIAPASAQYSTEGRATLTELERLRLEAAAANTRLAEAERAAAAAQEAEAALSAPPLPAVLPRQVWEKLELADGRVLHRARANAQDASSVTFLHREGVVKIDKRLLPAELAALFPFDARTAAREARIADQQRASGLAAQERREQSTRTAQRRTTAQAPLRPATPPTSLDAIASAADSRARAYFETEKRTGSGATLVFDFTSELDTPVAVAGWPHRWEVKGAARYKVYDSIGWGSFSTRSKKFRALVDAPPGTRPKVVDLSER